MPRDDFSIEVKRRLAQRAAYQCSMCGKITIGPSDETSDAVNTTGVAAHIAAASPGGRRYDSSQSVEERSSIGNAIWLCSLHADLIDGDEITYNIQFLKDLKEKHELKVKYKQQGFDVEKGMITALEIHNFGSVKQPLKFEFNRLNVIYGNNGTGKSLLCEMIAATTNRRFHS